MKRRDTIILWSVLTAVFAAVWTLTSSAAALICALFMALLLPVGHLLNLPAGKNMRLSVQIPNTSEKAESLTGEVRMQCGFWLPVGHTDVLLSFENRLTGEMQTQVVPLAAQGKEYVGVFSCSFAHAGSIRVRVHTVRLFELSGILSTHAKSSFKTYCTVFPQIYPVRLPDILALTSAEEIERYRENMRGSDRSETVWLREYTAGDAISGIHWKLSSKLDKLIYREPGAPEDRMLLLFWDRQSGSADVLDALADGVFSMCQALRDAGIPFTLGFIQDGETVLQRITDADTLYRTLPLLLRRDHNSTPTTPDLSGFGQILFFTANSSSAPHDCTQIYVCTPNAPHRLRALLQETDG